MSGPDPGLSAPDRRLLRRAALVVALQTAAAVTVVVAVVVLLVYTISEQERAEAMEHKARGAVEDVVAAGLPAGTGPVVTAAGLPDGCDDALLVGAVDTSRPGTSEVEVCRTPFLVVVDEVDGRTVVSATSVEEQRAETARLARLSVLVGLVGVVVSAVAGWVVARRAVRPLARALASQRRFVADASHELRTPIAILLARAQLLERTDDPDERRTEHAQLVRDARVLGDVVDDMLLAAESGRRRGDTQVVDLVRVVQEVRDAFAARAEEQGVDVVVDADPTVAACVDGLASGLRRAVAALVDNALAHTAPHGTVTLRVDVEERRVVLQVCDDGEGLDPRDADALTRRFARGDAPADGRRLGIGLALVSEIVSAHDGTLTVDGRRGEGATVTVALRRSRERTGPDPTAG